MGTSMKRLLHNRALVRTQIEAAAHRLVLSRVGGSFTVTTGRRLARAGMTGDDLRRMAMRLPEVEEKVTWEVDITFRVRDKIFAVMGQDGETASVKATLEVQQALVAAWTGLMRGDEVRELRPWLYRIAHNTALNQLRIAGYDYDELQGLLDSGPAPGSLENGYSL